MKITFQGLSVSGPGKVQLQAEVDVPAGKETAIVALTEQVQQQMASGKFNFWEGLVDVAALEAAQ